MAVSAFKSTSRRATSTTPPLPDSISSGGARKSSGGEAANKVVPPRRSRSVSAFSRTNLNVDSDFANKRDNPLYWSAEVDSPRLDGVGVGAVKLAKFEGDVSKVSSGIGSADGQSTRGRSVTRCADSLRGNSRAGGYATGAAGRSLSTVDTGRRRRSVSRGNYDYSESERGRGPTTLRSKSKSGSNGSHINSEGKSAVARSDSDLSELLKVCHLDASGASQWEDGGSMSSFSDVEERIGKQMSELLDAMRRSSSSCTLSTDISDMPLEAVNPAETELVLEVRGEYARKLEESQERARKLRAELAVEEHREVELNNILVDMVQHPEKPDAKKPYALRKSTMERRKMSRRLEEEALAYFDECVSISTFDGSDISSPEDPLSSIVGGAERNGNRMRYPGGSASISTNSCTVQIPDSRNPVQLKDTVSNNSSSISSLSSSKKSWNRQFSFSDKQKDSSDLKQELRSYVNIFTKDRGEESSNSGLMRRYRRDFDESLFISTETFLLERVANKYKIDSGGMLLCGGATGFPCSPFSNVL